jgi:transposase
MKFAVAALLGVTSAALSQKQLIHNQLVSLSGMVSEFEAPEKDAIFNRIAHRKDELANQLLAHPEHTQSILAEVATLKGLVRTVDAQNFDGAMSLMESRKELLKSELLSLSEATATVAATPAP